MIFHLSGSLATAFSSFASSGSGSSAILAKRAASSASASAFFCALLFRPRFFGVAFTGVVAAFGFLPRFGFVSAGATLLSPSPASMTARIDVEIM